MYQLQNIDYLYRISTMTGSSKLVTVQADRDSHDLNDKHFVMLNLCRAIVNYANGYEMYVMFPLPMTGMECGWAVSHGATTAATIQEAVQKFYPFMIEYICDKEDSDNDTQQYILKNLNSLGNSVDFWGRKNDRQHVIDGMSTTQKSQLLCYILRNHEAFGKMTCRDWKNWLLDDAEPQFGIWF